MPVLDMPIRELEKYMGVNPRPADFDEYWDKAIAEIGSTAEVTRFKGLGEISSNEMGRFIGEDIKLVPVEVSQLNAVPKLLEFYMGKNTPQRREFIVNNLLEEVDA